MSLNQFSLLYNRLSESGELKQEILFTILESGKSKVNVLADSVPSESPLPGLQMAFFSLYPHMSKK